VSYHSIFTTKNTKELKVKTTAKIIFTMKDMKSMKKSICSDKLIKKKFVVEASFMAFMLFMVISIVS
jgi:hypothetical protein